jgi:carbon monoxide dehydrogenase subunit G
VPLLREEIEVAKPLQEVWDFVGDFANSAVWDPGVSSAKKITEGPIGVGTRYELTIDFNGNSQTMTYEVTAYSPPGHIRLRGVGKHVSASDDISLVQVSESATRIRYVANLRLKGFARIAEPFLAKDLRELGRHSMAGLKAGSEREHGVGRGDG